MDALFSAPAEAEDGAVREENEILMETPLLELGLDSLAASDVVSRLG